MNKTMTGLLGAVGALAAAGATQAAPAVSTVMQASSYADLLKPIPNALAVQAVFAEQRATEAAPEATEVQYFYRHHHHHHHHHRYYRRRYHHHHHHHHHGF